MPMKTKPQPAPLPQLPADLIDLFDEGLNLALTTRSLRCTPVA